MKFTIEVKKDSANTYPGQMVISGDTDYVSMGLESPERGIVILKSDLIAVCRALTGRSEP